jgi:hypothetical protein
LQKVALSPCYPELPPLTAGIFQEVKAFEDWMRNKRYSESPNKTYKDSIKLFIRFSQVAFDGVVFLRIEKRRVVVVKV